LNIVSGCVRQFRELITPTDRGRVGVCVGSQSEDEGVRFFEANLGGLVLSPNPPRRTRARKSVLHSSFFNFDPQRLHNGTPDAIVPSFFG
jgi:hypothetical protein